MNPLFENARVATRLPCADLERARRYYSEKLGLEPSDEREGGYLYRFGETEFALFQSTGLASGDHTQMGFEVEDLDALVADLRERGADLESYEFPGVEQREGILEIPGTYPSKNARIERAIWLRDSEGNLIGFAELVR
ncbi:VOC family protein [Thermoleophilia bacterium SCSIO 60948]|nr:VOC family protein [Thermoleophilia bacterium SCSIO 60948]